MNGAEGPRIGGRDPPQLRGQQPGTGESARPADHDAGEYDDHDVADEEHNDRVRPGAQRFADPDLARAQADRIRQQSVDTNRGEQ